MFTRIDMDGRALSFEPAVRPLIALASGATRGCTIDRVAFSADEPRPAGAAVARLAAYDVEALDEWLLEEGLAQLDADEARGSLVFAPAAFSTLSTPRGRARLAPVISAAQGRLGAQLALEVTSLDPGLPPSRLIEVLTALRPICRVLFARLKPERRAIMALKDCRLDGVAIEAADLADPEDVKAVTRTRLALGGVGPRLLIHNLRTVSAINAAHEAGVTYASLDISAAAA